MGEGGEASAAFREAMRRNVAEIKERLNLHDLADALGLEKPKGSPNYRSPHHKDKNPSLSIFDGGTGWKDWSGSAGGDAFSLVMYCHDCDFPTANRWLHDHLGIRWPTQENAPKRERSKAEFIASGCLEQPELAVPYLRDVRKIPEATILEAIKHKTVGYSDWCSTKTPPGQIGHQGPAVAFIAHDPSTGLAEGVDKRFIDPDLNGGLKTWSAGDKLTLPWTPNRRLLAKARTLYVVESAINALSIEACREQGNGPESSLRGFATVATRGLQFEGIDWTRYAGKQVIICFDADEPNEKNERPGVQAAWRLYDHLTALNISAWIVDQTSWAADQLNDVNDVLKAEGVAGVVKRLRQLEEGAIAGLPARYRRGPQRCFLPSYDFGAYTRFKQLLDHTQYFAKLPVEADEDEGTEARPPELVPLSGFRLAALSRITVQSPQATAGGAPDAAPTVQFAATVQVPRHGADLQRRVFRDEDVHNVEKWQKFGPIYDPKQFKRLVGIYERTTEFGARRVANFVGVAWLDGKLRVNEASDCYFELPDKQCPYHEHRFARGTTADARRVIEEYQRTFRQNAAAIPLVWVLGGVALKTMLGFWPHAQMQANKGSGKSTLITKLSAATGFTMFSSQQLKTEYRIVGSVSHTSLAVGWEEISANRQDVIDRAVTTLQECYQFTPHTRGSENLRYLNAAPVLLAGEDVPVRSLAGKLIRTTLTSAKRGPLIDDKLPQFPMRQWLEWVCELQVDQVRDRFKRLVSFCQTNSRASGHDVGAQRMANNYAALLLTWKLLAEFAGIDETQGGFIGDCLAEMNSHIGDTSEDREPYIWILEKLASELSNGKFEHPYAWREVAPAGGGEKQLCLVIQTSRVMDHMASATHLREFFNGLPVKSGRVFKSQCMDAGVFVDPDLRTVIGGRDLWHCQAISIQKLLDKGISMPVRVQDPSGTPTDAGRASGYQRAADFSSPED